jgi:hypothetical protein
MFRRFGLFQAASFLFAGIVLAMAIGDSPLHGQSAQMTKFRPPAVPLVTSDPYLSIWSDADRLTDDATRHWTHREHPLVSLIRIDGKTYRLMGNDPKELPAFEQRRVQVTPTQTYYNFGDGHVRVTLIFTTPALPDDLDVLARPVTYLTWTVASDDGAPHKVQIYSSVSSLLTVNTPDQKVEWARETAGPLTALRVGTAAQTLLAPAGDDTRIDWGYAYAAAPTADATAAIGGNGLLLNTFITGGNLPAADDKGMPRAAKDDQPVLAFAFDLGNVAALRERHLLIAYDELYSIKLLGQKLRPYWRRNGATAGEMLQAAESDYRGLLERCGKFDNELMSDIKKMGGEKYAQIAALAYRQAIAGCGLAADANKQPLLFTKENTSNGCIATVDVIYPAAPQFLLMGPTYAKALVMPALVYSASPAWKFPFAPHDLGTYPQAKGQDYGGGESAGNEGDKMPVEESANMLLLIDAIAKMEGNAEFAGRWWPQLTQWNDYLEKHGIDPENQLCTDDFMGHLARNANLSAKAILGIAAYSDLCRMRGDVTAAEKHRKVAKEGAAFWMKTAADGNHYRIAFDKPNSWSQKYNLVWDKLLGLDIFPAKVAADEVAYYKSVIQPFGVPLDSRTHLTKTDWSLWVATMADSRADFETMVSPIYDYLDRTTNRQPFVDSYVTDNAASDGMHARPVIGGVFIKMLSDPAMWKKWSSRDRANAGNWADAPRRPKMTEIVPTSQHGQIEWSYTFEKPAGDWTKPSFDDSQWQRGAGGFGTRGTPHAVVGTTWNTSDIWLRREATLPEKIDPEHLQLLVYHDEDVEIYINGVLAGSESGFVNAYDPMDMSAAARAQLKPGAKIVLAVHCHQTVGGQGVDVGLVEVVER